jgi:hypothetical protein
MPLELKRTKLTVRFVNRSPTGGRRSRIFLFDEVIGFGVQVGEIGRKSLTSTTRSRQRLYIGDFDKRPGRTHDLGLDTYSSLLCRNWCNALTT